MSLATWKKEFYRTPADKVSKDKALEHSIKKWTGLLPRNRKKHGVKFSLGELKDAKSNKFNIDSSSCALCVCYNSTGVDCANCLLSSVSDDEHPCNEVYEDAFDNNKITPMIKLLKKAQKKGKIK